MKMLFFVLFGIALFSCETESKPKDLTENEIYFLINEIIVDDTLFFHNVYFKPDFGFIKGEFSNQFSKEDVVFHNRQMKIFRNFTFKEKRIKRFHPYKSNFVKIDSVGNEGSVEHMSFPIISKNRKTVLFEIQNDCNCFLGGSGGNYLYKKIKGKWVLIKCYDCWIS